MVNNRRARYCVITAVATFVWIWLRIGLPEATITSCVPLLLLVAAGLFAVQRAKVGNFAMLASTGLLTIYLPIAYFYRALPARYVGDEAFILVIIANNVFLCYRMRTINRSA